MPQMAPLSWLTLFIFFSLILLLFNLINYFLTSPVAPASSSDSYLSNSFHWKW